MSCMTEEGVNDMVASTVKGIWHDVAANLGALIKVDKGVDGYEPGNKDELLDKQETEYQEAMVLGELHRQTAKVENSRVRKVRADGLSRIVDTIDSFDLGEGECACLIPEDDDMESETVNEYLPGARAAVNRGDLWSVLGKKLTLLVQQCLKDRKVYWSEFISAEDGKHCTLTEDVIRKSHQAVDDELFRMMVLYRRGLSMFPELVEEAMQVSMHKDILESLMDASCVGVLVQHELEERTAVCCIEALVGLQEKANRIFVELIQSERFIEHVLDHILGNSLIPERDAEKYEPIDKGAELPSSSEAIMHDEHHSKAEIARSEAKEYIFTRLSREGAKLVTSNSAANSKNDPNHLERRASALAMLLLHTNDVD
eukprot:jgi/Picsp_1/2215/NSC_05679-R1_---NA---